ncbi:MAG: VWA domain-containing protein [Planctomycetota bacterium]
MTFGSLLEFIEQLRFADSSWLSVLIVAPIALALLALELVLRRRAMRRLFSTDLRRALGGNASLWRRLTRATLRVVAISAVLVALARPQTPGEEREVEAEGREVVFVVDVSRSMLARDLRPNRLEQAKLWILDALSASQGDRFGMVAFAGEPVIVAPLTSDVTFLSLVVNELSPLSVGRGGTNIGDAVRLAVQNVLGVAEGEDDRVDPASRGGRDLILITDGEDHGTLPVEAAKAAAAAGVRIIAIGIGDEGRGTTIELEAGDGRTRPLRHEGEVVYSRLDADTLREMALATRALGGRYFNVATGTIRLDEVYRELVRDAERRHLGAVTVVEHREWFQWAMAAALALILIEGLIGERGRRG